MFVKHNIRKIFKSFTRKDFLLFGKKHSPERKFGSRKSFFGLITLWNYFIYFNSRVSNKDNFCLARQQSVHNCRAFQFSIWYCDDFASFIYPQQYFHMRMVLDSIHFVNSVIKYQFDKYTARVSQSFNQSIIFAYFHRAVSTWFSVLCILVLPNFVILILWFLIF